MNQINANCRDKLGEYCHWGATTQDITDTAAVLQIREGLALVEVDLKAISASLARLAREHRDTPVIGRSNLMVDRVLILPKESHVCELLPRPLGEG